ncbi:MAG: phage portal protein [Dehalococcoidia bacterium]
MQLNLAHNAKVLLGMVQGIMGGGGKTKGVLTTSDFPGMTFSTWAGPVILATNAHKIAAVKCAVRILSETMLSASWQLKIKKGQGGRDSEEVTTHPSSILTRQANDLMDDGVFRETGTAIMTLWGNFHAKIERDRLGNAIQLWPYPGGQVIPKEIISGPTGKVLIYRTTDHLGKMEDVPSTEMFSIHGLGFDGIQGRSMIEDHRETLGLAVSMEQHQATMMGKGAAPAGVLETDGRLKDASVMKRLVDSWEATYGGARNAGKVAVLEDGLKYKPVTVPAKDIQFLESRKFLLAEVARIFRIPLHMLEEMDRATFNNVEHRSLEFLLYTMVPHVTKWKKECARKLVNKHDREGLFWDFDLSWLLRGDRKTFHAALAIGRQWGWLSANDCRTALGMNGIGPDGDIYLQPGNMIVAGDEIDPAATSLMDDEDGDGESTGPPEKEDTEDGEKAREFNNARQTLRLITSRREVA